MDNRVGIKGSFEATDVMLHAEMKPLNSQEQRDVVAQQIIDDDNVLKNEGDTRYIKQQGKIGSPDGETFIDTELTFARTRNKSGGVDVVCHVPCLGFSEK